MADNKYYNRIALSTGEVLIDLTQDDVRPEVVDKGITFHDKTGAPQVGTSTKTVDASGATADPSEVLDTRTFGKGSEMKTGTMPNNSGKDVEIKSKDGTVIPRGYYDGISKVKLSDTDLANLIAGNIKEGVTILGVDGEYGADDISSQSKTVSPTFEEQVVNPDEGFAFLSSVKVEAIKVTRTDNEFGGVSVVIG